MKVLLTGGAGFIGSNIATLLKRDRSEIEIIAFDNLRRRGSELALARLSAVGVSFCHGDIRQLEDLEAVGPFDLLIECSAEPSVHAGYGDDPRYLVHTNLFGTFNCLEIARRHRADVIFLSTSRVYPIDRLRNLPLERSGKRFSIRIGAGGQGWSEVGISTDFPLSGSRSLYGATKLASEVLIEEYHAVYGLRTVINRCGVVTGPWQMGKVDQGFVVLWAARHLFGGSLAYSGFGGEGVQVRDLLHIEDLYDLIRAQIDQIAVQDGRLFNVGGGITCSVSLAELTDLCRQRSVKGLEIGRDPNSRPADIPYYITDNAAVTRATGWRPVRSVNVILNDIFTWLDTHRNQLETVLS